MVKLTRVIDFNRFELSDMLAGQILELLIDTEKNQAFHVSPSVGHSKAASYYLGKDESHINELSAGHLVSALVEIESNVVKKITVGISSLELGHNIRHSPKQIEKAVAILESILKLSRELREVEISKSLDIIKAKAA